MPVHFISQPASGSAFNPLSLTPSFWVDFSDAASVTLNGSNVSQINDKSGFARHATQATAGNQPAYTSGGFNGLNCATFDGTTKFLASSAFTMAYPFTIFAVARGVAADTAQRNITSNIGGTSGFVYKTATTKLWSLYSGTVLSSATADNGGSHVVVGEFNGASSAMRLDNASIASGAAGSNGYSTGLWISSNGAGQPWSGLVGELLVAFNPSSGLRDAYVEWLRAKWGTS